MVTLYWCTVAFSACADMRRFYLPVLLLLHAFSYFSVATGVDNDEDVTKLMCDLDTGEFCGDHQLCSPNSETPKVGICLCVKGYHRVNGSRDCAVDEVIASAAATDVKLAAEKRIEFGVDGPASVQLPQKSVTLKVNVTDPTFDYHWELIGGTGRAEASTYNEPTLTLTDLQVGQLVFRVNVKNSTHDGHRNFNLTILPPKRPNSPPKAVIRPQSPVIGVEGSQIVLDAEGSSDDDKIVAYNWFQDTGPSVSLPAMNTAVLKLDKLVPGEYQFSVIVKDEEGLSSNASVVVQVAAERDDPPKARIVLCGSSKTGSLSVRLPLEQLLLCGNGSTDDKGIESYNWFRVDNLAGKLAVDMSGSSSGVLTLTNIQENEHLGPYEFQLDVKDTKGQNDSTRITIFVNKAANLAPEVDAGGNQTVILPQSSFILNGNVKDDGSIVSYEWSQLEGPNLASFSNGNQPKATVSGLVEGIYAFRLMVVDDGGINASSVAYVSVERGRNEPPVARAPNITVFLPHSVAVLNASMSTDDAGIVSYKWTPFDDVPAVMRPLDGSDERAVMYVTGLVKGVHLYTLTVADQQKASDAAVVALSVEQGSEDVESVEMISTLTASEVSFRLRAKLEDRIAAVLASSIKEVTTVNVTIGTVEEIPLDGRLRIVFWASSRTTDNRMRRSVSILPNGIIPAEEVVEILRTDRNMHEDFSIVSIEPLYCKLTCSSHGYCSNVTKQCVCDGFWMTSLFSLLTNGWRHTDCAWSSLYFWLISMAVVSCSFFCCVRKKCMWAPVSRRRFRRRPKYTSLKSDSDHESEALRIRRAPRLKPLPLPPSSDSLESEDDLLVSEGWEMSERRPHHHQEDIP